MKPKIIAHRGFPKKYPENTILSFKKAIEAGADGIELDTQFTSDKKVVVHHMSSLGSTDNGEGLIFKTDSSVINKLDAGSWFNGEFKNERIPYLDKLFNELGKEIIYDVELKAYGREYVDAVLQIVQELDMLSSVQFTSFQYPLLAYIKRQNPKANVGLISPRIEDWMDNQIAREFIKSHLILEEMDVIHCPVDVCDRAFVDDIHALGIKIHFGVCDTREQIEKAADLGADEFTTNDIELAVKMVKN